MSKILMSELIDRAINTEGRKQGWVVQKMNDAGCNITEVQFSRKKKGYEEFTTQEMLVLCAILNIKL